MALARHAHPDPYTLEELRREYEGADWRGRTGLLRRVDREVGIPAELVALAVKDEHSQVRQWIARFGHLYSEHEEQLGTDPDEFVRACLRENPSRNHFWISKHWHDAPENASHLELLAMVRNPHVDSELIEKIFDLENHEFGLDMDARHELASAFLTNEPALDHGQISYTDWCRRVGTDDASGFIGVHQGARKHFDKLWALASQWPAADIELGVRYWIYRYVGADDKTKAETYGACQEPALRRAILRNTRLPVDPYGSFQQENPSTSEATKLGLQDDDPKCRRLAAGRRGPPPKNKKMRSLSYAWSIIWAAVPNAIAIALALKLFASASTSFETIVFAVLTLVYTAVTWMSYYHGVAASGQAVLGARRYLRIIELLRDSSYKGESKDALDESLRNQEEAVQKKGVLAILQSVWSTA